MPYQKDGADSPQGGEGHEKVRSIIYLFTQYGRRKRVQLIDRFKSIIEADGTVTNVDEWGVRKLAYLIDDIGEGYYTLINFEGTPAVVDELDRIAKISDSVMRHMIIRDE